MIDMTSSTMFRLDNLNKEQVRISYQQSSGKVIDRGSDNTLIFAREIYIEDKITVYTGIQNQIIKTQAQNSNSDGALGEMKKLIDYVKSEVIKALNDTVNPDARKSISVQIEGVKKNVLILGNEKIEGEYLFAGSNTTVKPFEQDATTGKVTYNGNGYLREVAVEFGSYRDKGVNGFDMMTFSTSISHTTDNLTFTEGEERVIDKEGNEWKFVDANNDGTLSAIEKTKLYKFDFDGKTKEYLKISPTANAGEFISDNTVGTSFLDPGATPKTLTNPEFHTKKNIFDVLDNIIDGLATNDKDKMREGLTDITDSFDAVNKAHADLGARNKVFDLSYERVSSKLTQFDIFYREVSSSDPAKLAIEAKSLELTFVSLYSTINRLNKLSLVNYLN
ncbi:MAG: flagellar hook-associated protein FlgL [Campylobacteraceae bacterium]|nr:flagellar hook-associated protein FlgL [Campylobacteraceae bacterium]